MRSCRFIRFAVVFVAVCMLISAFTVSAQTVVITEKAERDGDKITYTVSVSPDSGLCGLTLELKYDTLQLEIDSSSAGKALEGGITQKNDKMDGRLLLSYISTDPLKIGGEMLAISFTDISDGKSKLKISLNIKEFIDGDTDNIAYNLKSSDNIDKDYMKPAEPPQNTSSESVGGEQTASKPTSGAVSSNTASNPSKDNSSAQSGNTVSDGSVQDSGDASDTASREQSGVESEGAPSAEGDALSEKEPAKASDGTKGAIIIVAVIIAAALASLILYKAKFFRRNRK